MKKASLCIALCGFFACTLSYGQGSLIKAKLKLNKGESSTQLKGMKIFSDFKEGVLWIYRGTDRGKAQNWLINSEPWGSIRFEQYENMSYYGRAEMGQSFVEFESWVDTISQQNNWVIKSLNDVFFLRKEDGFQEQLPAYSLFRQIITDKGRTDVLLITFRYDPEERKQLLITDEAPLSDYPLLMKVTAAWLSILEGLGDVDFLQRGITP